MEMYALSRIMHYAWKSTGDVVVVAGGCHIALYAIFLEKYLRIKPKIVQYTEKNVRIGTRKTCVGPNVTNVFAEFPVNVKDDCLW